MRIPKDVILIWTGSNSNIPSYWSRETLLDGRFIFGWGNENVGTTGGFDSHTHSASDAGHTLQNHTHTYYLWGTSTSQWRTQNWTANYPNFNLAIPHDHTGTSGNISGGGLSSVNFTTGSASNNPPYKNVIFIKASHASVLQSGICVLWPNSNIPNGWVKETSYDEKYLRGADSGNDAGGEGGSLNHSHNLSYNHTIIPHSHSYSTSSSWPGVSGGNVFGTNLIRDLTTYIHSHTVYFGNDNTANTTLNVNITYNTTETVEPPFKKLILLKYNGGIKEKGIIGLWLGSESTIPKGWYLCDGNNNTPNLKNFFIKITMTESQVGQSGGNLTHSHAPYSHTHSGISHYHSYSTSGANSNTNEPNYVNQNNTTPKSHTHSGNTDSATMNWDYSNITFDNVSNLPLYIRVIFIQFQKEIWRGASLFSML